MIVMLVISSQKEQFHAWINILILSQVGKDNQRRYKTNKYMNAIQTHTMQHRVNIIKKYKLSFGRR